jgi:flotillin
MSQKAEAMKELVLAAGGAREAYQLLLVEHLDTLAETSARAISNIKFDKVVVWDSGNGAASASGFLQNMARTLPPMMHVLRDIAGVELPGYLGKVAEGAADGAGGGVGEVPPPVVVPDDARVPRAVEMP